MQDPPGESCRVSPSGEGGYKYEAPGPPCPAPALTAEPRGQAPAPGEKGALVCLPT